VAAPAHTTHYTHKLSSFLTILTFSVLCCQWISQILMHANNQYTIVAYYYTIFKCGITIPIYFMSLQKNRMLCRKVKKRIMVRRATYSTGLIHLPFYTFCSLSFLSHTPR